LNYSPMVLAQARRLTFGPCPDGCRGLNYTPTRTLRTRGYFVSLCCVCLLQCLQNFFNSNRSLRIFLFFLEK